MQKVRTTLSIISIILSIILIIYKIISVKKQEYVLFNRNDINSGAACNEYDNKIKDL